MTPDEATGWPETPRNGYTTPPPDQDTHERETDPTGPATGETDQGGQPGGRALSPADEEKALELAAAGVPYRRIGALFGVSHVTVWRAVQRAYADHHDQRWSSLKEFVARESVRLDRLDQVWLPKALRGEVNAAVVVLRTHTARVRLAAAAGLTAPTRSASTVTVTTGGNSVIDQEIAALVKKLEEAGQAGPVRD